MDSVCLTALALPLPYILRDANKGAEQLPCMHLEADS